MQHKVDWGPGTRFFECGECEHKFEYNTRHCESPSGETCPVCGDWCVPVRYEKHYEWQTDKSGNLIS